ncbi:hypothetical protein CRM22_010820 [Opisthorchis felineus]|uniref:Protein sleepless n=1 Tax=Opisthorchis felineus TaxID=147828 RepID=A0A4S2KL63_OPIFE|nr:hypothetical protein CRM22_010820 [Opisthorchis felineus]
MLRLLVCVILLIYRSNGKSCYVCNSSVDANCLDSFSPHRSPLRPTRCNVVDARFCIKTTGIYGGFVGVNRFCSSFDLGTQCDYVSFPDHDRIYRACVFTCSSDECNRASLVSTSWLSIGPSIALLINLF